MDDLSFHERDVGGGSAETYESKLEEQESDFAERGWHTGPLGQVGATHEVLVDEARSLAAFTDRPDDKRLPPSHVACRENARHAGHFLFVYGDIAAFVDGNAKLIEHALAFGSQETHRQQHQIRIEREA